MANSGSADQSLTSVESAHQATASVADPYTEITGPASDPVDERRDVVDRRRRPVRAFLYGNFHPRRRAHRRSDDDHRFVFDWHEPRILYLVVSILLLSCTDALFTLNLLTVGAEEANFLMNSLLEQSVDKFLTVKISLTAVSLIFLVIAAKRHFMGWFRVERLLHVICIGYIGLIVYELYLFKLVLDLEFPWHNVPAIMLSG
jgi:hypothetical protein